MFESLAADTTILFPGDHQEIVDYQEKKGFLL
jgi:hypothetical protein